MYNAGFYDDSVTFMNMVFKYKSHVNDLPNLEFDRWEWYNTIIYQYHIEFFLMFVCFEDELGKFERELKEKITFNS